MHNGMARNYSVNMSIPACQNSNRFDEENNSLYGYGAQRSGEIGFENSIGYRNQQQKQIPCQTSIWVSISTVNVVQKI